MEEYSDNLYLKLRRAREGSKLTQADIARKLGLGRAAVSLWEQTNAGIRTHPNLKQLIIFADTCGVPPAYFVDGNADAEEVYRAYKNGRGIAGSSVPLVEMSEMDSMTETEDAKHPVCPVPDMEASIATEMTDNSMLPKINRKDIVFVNKSKKHVSGDTCLLKDSHAKQYSIAEVIFDAGEFKYRKTNADYEGSKPRPIDDNQEIVGVVIGSYTPH